MRVKFFKSRNVSWVPGIKLKRARWHSCMRWGKSEIQNGNRLDEFADYWVLYICYRKRGICWHVTQKKGYEHTYKDERTHNEV